MSLHRDDIRHNNAPFCMILRCCCPLFAGSERRINDSHWWGFGVSKRLVKAMPTSWYVPPSVRSNVDGRLPVHSVGITSDPLCVTECISFACLGWWWDWRVEGNPDEQTVTRCHVVGGGEHNGHLKEKVNNINPCLYVLLQPACSGDPSPTTWMITRPYRSLLQPNNNPLLQDHLCLHGCKTLLYCIPYCIYIRIYTYVCTYVYNEYIMYTYIQKSIFRPTKWKKAKKLNRFHVWLYFLILAK